MGLKSFFSRKKKSKSEEATPDDSTGSCDLPKSPRTQRGELENVFKQFDVDGDGKISWSELGEIMGSLGHTATEEELKQMVTEVDGDGDGFIDLNEFIEMNTKEIDAEKAMEDIKNAFSIFDADGNGTISPDELQKVLRSLGDKVTVAECRKMINGVDKDGDGLINFDEFKLMMMGPATKSVVEL